MPRGGAEGGFSGPLSWVAVAGVALGVVVMVMAVSVLRGFQGEIAGKVAGFGSHITVSGEWSVAGGQLAVASGERPVAVDSALLGRLSGVPGVRAVQCYATKGGMVKTGEQIHGVVLRGVSAGSDMSFLSSCLKEGRLFSSEEGERSSEVLVSETVAKKLGLEVGGKMRTYFWQDNNYRARAFTVSGVYNTDLREMDEVFVLGDLREVQVLNGWGDSMVGGYELLVEDLGRLEECAAGVKEVVPYDLCVRTVKEVHAALFAWLDLLNSNMRLILTIMCIVSAIAVVSALLIMIFEKGGTIGLLKALGASGGVVRRIFLLKGLGLVLRGIVVGEALSVALCVVQLRWQVLRLDAESYSMGHVPVDGDPWIFVFVGLGTFVVCLVALLLPTWYISRISPALTVRQEK